jgi:hypothetical protein
MGFTIFVIGLGGALGAWVAGRIFDATAKLSMGVHHRGNLRMAIARPGLGSAAERPEQAQDQRPSFFYFKEIMITRPAPDRDSGVLYLDDRNTSDQSQAFETTGFFHIPPAREAQAVYFLCFFTKRRLRCNASSISARDVAEQAAHVTLALLRMPTPVRRNLLFLEQFLREQLGVHTGAGNIRKA